MSKVTEYRDSKPQDASLAGGLAVAIRDAEAVIAARPVIGDADKDNADKDNANTGDADQV